MPGGAGKKVSEYLGRRITVLTKDEERFDGRFLGYDKFMNLILSDCERTRAKKKGGVERRAAGFIVLRGEHVAAISVVNSILTERTVQDSVVPRDTTTVDVVDGERVSAITRAAKGLHIGLSH